MSSRRALGFTLIEMIIAIVIISVGLAGVLLAFNTAVKSSADPLIHKQMLAVAEEMMEEVLLKSYAVTGSPPTNVATTCSAARSRAAFDDIRDYSNFQTIGICDIDGTAITGLDGYNVSVTVTSPTWQGIADTLTINVTVSHGTENMRLNGWRTGYALP